MLARFLIKLNSLAAVTGKNLHPAYRESGREEQVSRKKKKLRQRCVLRSKRARANILLHSRKVNRSNGPGNVKGGLTGYRMVGSGHVSHYLGWLDGRQTDCRFKPSARVSGKKRLVGHIAGVATHLLSNQAIRF